MNDHARLRIEDEIEERYKRLIKDLEDFCEYAEMRHDDRLVKEVRRAIYELHTFYRHELEWYHFSIENYFSDGRPCDRIAELITDSHLLIFRGTIQHKLSLVRVALTSWIHTI